MNQTFLYPEGKKKALILSYDDGQVYDRKLIDIFNKYGLKGTFHLNSANFTNPAFISAKEAISLYKGHEIACHGVEHLYPNQLTKEQLVFELWENRRHLEEITQGIVKGFSYPFGEYSDRVIQTAKDLGIVYSRTVVNQMGFSIPGDFMKWNPTCHHNDAFENLELIDLFLNPPGFYKMSLFFIWGHSFEFERENTWEKMDKLCAKLGGHDDIWYTTGIEYYHYMKAIENLEYDVTLEHVYNPSRQDIWVEKDGKVSVI